MVVIVMMDQVEAHPLGIADVTIAQLREKVVTETSEERDLIGGVFGWLLEQCSWRHPAMISWLVTAVNSGLRCRR